MADPRAVLIHVEQDTDGVAQTGKSITVYEVDGTTPLGQTMYDDPTIGLGNVLTNPLSTSALGVAKAYVGVPQGVFVKPSGSTGYPSRFDVDTASLWTVSIRRYKPTAGQGADDSAAFTAAIAALGTAGGTILLPGGPGTVYGIGSQVTLASNVHIYSHGATIKRVSNFTGHLFASSDATITNVVFEGIVFDNNLSAGTLASVSRVLSLPNGMSNVTLRHCTFTNFSYPNLINVAAGSLRSDGFTIDTCQFLRTLAVQIDNTASIVSWPNGLSLENTQTVTVTDTSHVTIKDSVFSACDGIGLVASTASATPVRSIVFENNKMSGIHTTGLFVQVGGVSATIEDVHITGNSWIDCGLTAEKGAISLGANSPAGVVRGVHIRGNTIRGFGYADSSPGGIALDLPNNAAQAIITGGNLVDDLEISGNTIDGRSSAGVSPTGGNFGIYIGNFTQHTRIFGNTLRYCGYAGIHLVGSVTNTVNDITVTGNTVDHCALLNDLTALGFIGGIYVGEYCDTIIITGNVSKANGNATAAALAAGIVVQHSATISYITIQGNICYDDQGTPRQLYGVRVGTPAGTTVTRPTFVTVMGNVVYNNVTAGLSYDNSSSGTYFLWMNPGAATGAGTPPKDSAPQMTLAGSAASSLGTVNANTTSTQAITVAGAIQGYSATVAHTTWTATEAGVKLAATVTAADTVTVTATNTTGGNIVTPAGTLKVQVWAF